ncbi:hypothetical protein CJI97_004092 [Candidozyma auris]|uniref:hypothetical_protein n=1 Tax=Candidozyma auris TaxID=498019 RepID=UPI000C392A38|nr:hypothetical_protein [[Candida] auris]PIS54389.1 hypothetical protein CJI97_004092 [[Candida] auris]PSK79273.1 hypothetical protein CJJ07_000775 [[Candida] auris]QEO21701.1 hypothetical_protein [[Candida] auris]GBL47802.1 hypothetical protein CAJCM15448_00760 [[Candida] auris]
MLRGVAKARIRCLSTSAPRGFFFNLPDKKLVEKQDELKPTSKSKVVFLNEKNSPNYKAFDPERDTPGFRVNQWKDKVVQRKEIEGSYTAEEVTNIMNETFEELQGSRPSSFDGKDLHDLEFRFKYCKRLQQKLGFDLSDYLITRSHSLQDLLEEVKMMVTHRWSSERNPNAVVLRPEDFADAPNVYLNRELSEKAQQKLFKQKLKEAQAQG